MPEGFDILFEDGHVIVVAKPARLLTASDDTGDDTLLAKVRAYNAGNQAEGKKGYLVPLHFLDRPVSGVVMLAKSSKAAARLSEAFRSRKVTKVYHALVEGQPPSDGGEAVDFLTKDKDDNVSRVVPEGTGDAKRCVLSWRVVERKGRLTRLEVRPVTGRSHQIRVQLSSRDMPIYGDVKYGASTAWDGAIALHAAAVTFSHPVSKEPVTVKAPEPASWRSLWRE